MTIKVKFKFEDERYYYKNYSYWSGEQSDAARDFEFLKLINQAQQESHEMGAEIENVFVIK